MKGKNQKNQRVLPSPFPKGVVIWNPGSRNESDRRESASVGAGGEFPVSGWQDGIPYEKVTDRVASGLSVEAPGLLVEAPGLRGISVPDPFEGRRITTPALSPGAAVTPMPANEESGMIVAGTDCPDLVGHGNGVWPVVLSEIVTADGISGLDIVLPISQRGIICRRRKHPTISWSRQ